MLERLFKNTVILSVTQVLSRLLSFIFSLILARYLGTELFGIFTYAYTLVLLLSFAVDFGLSSLIVREIAQDRAKTNDCLSNSLIIRLLLSTIVYVGILVHAFTLSGVDIDKRELLTILGLFLFVKSFFEISLSLFQAYERQDIYGWLQLMYSIILVGAAGLLIFFRANFHMFGVIPVIAGIFSALIGISLVLKSITFKPAFSISSVVSLMRRTVSFGLTLLVTASYARMGILMLSWIGSDAEVGQYGVAYRLMEGLLFVPMVLSRIVYPLLSRISLKKDEFRFVVEKSIRILVVSASLMTLLGVVYTNQIIVFLYSSVYMESVLVFQILVWSLIASFPNYVLGHSLFSLHKQGNVLVIACATLIINVILNLILIPRFGIVGTAYTALVSVVIPFICYLWCLRRSLVVVEILRITCISLLICVGLVVLGVLTRDFIPVSILVICLSSFYLLLSYLFGLIEAADIMRIKALVSQKLARQ